VATIISDPLLYFKKRGPALGGDGKVIAKEDGIFWEFCVYWLKEKFLLLQRRGTGLGPPSGINNWYFLV